MNCVSFSMFKQYQICFAKIKNFVDRKEKLSLLRDFLRRNGRVSSLVVVLREWLLFIFFLCLPPKKGEGEPVTSLMTFLKLHQGFSFLKKNSLFVISGFVLSCGRCVQQSAVCIVFHWSAPFLPDSLDRSAIVRIQKLFGECRECFKAIQLRDADLNTQERVAKISRFSSWRKRSFGVKIFSSCSIRRNNILPLGESSPSAMREEVTLGLL